MYFKLENHIIEGANTPDMCPDISIKPSFSGVRGHAMCGAFPPHRIHLDLAGKWLQTQLIQSAHSKNIHLVKKKQVCEAQIERNLTLCIKVSFREKGRREGVGARRGLRRRWSGETRGMLESEWERGQNVRKAEEGMRREQWGLMKMAQRGNNKVVWELK